MPTRLYLQSVVAGLKLPTAGEKSVVLPVGSQPSNSWEGDGAMITSVGQANNTITVNTLAQTTDQDVWFYRFNSLPLAAHTFAAANWTLSVGVAENNAAVNAFTAASLYIWRPDTQAVLGYIYDSHTSLGTEYPTTLAQVVSTFAGASIAILEGDTLVLEVWAHMVQSMATAYTVSFGYGQTAQFQSYLECTDNLTFATPAKVSAGVVATTTTIPTRLVVDTALEVDLVTLTTAQVFQVALNVSSMQEDDVLELSVFSKVLSTSTERGVLRQQLVGRQAEATAWLSIPFYSLFSIRFTLKQLAGATPRTIPWSVRGDGAAQVASGTAFFGVWV